MNGGVDSDGDDLGGRTGSHSGDNEISLSCRKSVMNDRLAGGGGRHQSRRRKWLSRCGIPILILDCGRVAY